MDFKVFPPNLGMRFCGGNMALSVKLYRVVGKGKDRATFRLIWDGGGRRSKQEVMGPFCLRPWSTKRSRLWNQYFESPAVDIAAST